MDSVPPLVTALRGLAERPALIGDDGRPVSGAALLTGTVPADALSQAVAARVRAARAATRESDPHERRLRYWASVLGPPPIRHTVLLPPTGLGVELALATLLAGGTVVHGDPDRPPAELLAELARSRSTHLSLPSELLWQISELGDQHAQDLDNLRRVLHVGPEPRQQDVYAAVEALGAVVAHVRAPRSDAESADTALREVAAAATDAAWKRLIGVSAEQARVFTARLDAAVLSSMLLALRRDGVLEEPGRGHRLPEILRAARVAPAHHRLVGRWLAELTRHGLTTRRGELFAATRPVHPADTARAWQSAADAWTGRLGSATVIDHLRTAAERLPTLLTGEQQAAALLLPKGSTRVIEALAARTAAGRYRAAVLAAALRRIAADHPGPGPLRVLELAAGPGTATGEITRALADRTAPAADYLCTDPSDLLLAAVRARVGRHPHLRYARFDLHEPGPGPGAVTGPFDVVVADGALARAPDPDLAARRLTALLAPGGWLLLNEPVRTRLEFLVRDAFLPHLHPHDPRTDPDAPPPGAPRWHAALARAGVRTVLAVTGDDHPVTLLGDQLLAARTGCRTE
ncbi:methyltransferase family protein [Kitasatospora sp. SolWspMP-SS2h]|uniref:methyltransferase n=1 Tax=Kitasatospora sp. SolWspMP-SS2h TaxID=1305729 RepID=UPI000DBA8E02|nr:methyltransferase [Kitasatospora sp. SolWspMP-SS2h]RAJ38426.1 methyltransferase family protein [Kitasatospora sp. SolWspMP-SS2h]